MGHGIHIPLLLEIESCSCVCGNRWTHSYTRHINGGSLNGPGEVVAIYHFPKPEMHTCFACVKPGLPVQRYEPRKREEPKAPLNLLD